MQKSRKRNCEDIRSQWTTNQNLNQWFDDCKQVLLDWGFAEDKQVLHKDGTVEEVYISDKKKKRILCFDETGYTLSSKTDNDNPCSGSYTYPNLPRSGDSSTRGSRHATGVYSHSACGVNIPPLYIYDSKAANDEKFKVRPEWCKNLPIVEGYYGCPTKKKWPSHAERPSSGSMTDHIFQQCVNKCVSNLYPNISEFFLCQALKL